MALPYTKASKKVFLVWRFNVLSVYLKHMNTHWTKFYVKIDKKNATDEA